MTEPASKALFVELDRASVDCLQWKSNEHLHEALLGETDLDLLIHDADSDRFEKVLAKLGYVEMDLQRSVMFPGRAGYLGFDPAAGSQIHLDVHSHLILGEQLVKNHHLPIEDWLFQGSRHLDGVPVPSAAKEFVVFYVRVVLKTTTRQRLRARRTGTSPLPASIQTELDWLADQVNPAELDEAVTSSGLSITPDEVKEFHRLAQGEGPSWRYLRDRKRSLKTRLRIHEREPRPVVLAKQASRRLRASRPFRKLGLGVKPKTLTGGGVVVALVGADGSGKTRLSRDLESWLRWKLTVRHLYFGQPKTGFVFKALNKPGSMVRHRVEDGSPSGRFLSRAARITETLKWALLARRRGRLSQTAMNAARSGEIVIAERYPLEELQHMATPIDGPRLQTGPRSGRLAKYERRQYEAIPVPDLVIVLTASLETLRSRKIDLGFEEHQAKVEAIQTLQSKPGRVVIDAENPYDQVLLSAKASVWEALLARR